MIDSNFINCLHLAQIQWCPCMIWHHSLKPTLPLPSHLSPIFISSLTTLLSLYELKWGWVWSHHLCYRCIVPAPHPLSLFPPTHTQHTTHTRHYSRLKENWTANFYRWWALSFFFPDVLVAFSSHFSASSVSINKYTSLLLVPSTFPAFTYIVQTTTKKTKKELRWNQLCLLLVIVEWWQQCWLWFEGLSWSIFLCRCEHGWNIEIVQNSLFISVT